MFMNSAEQLRKRGYGDLNRNRAAQSVRWVVVLNGESVKVENDGERFPVMARSSASARYISRGTFRLMRVGGSRST